MKERLGYEPTSRNSHYTIPTLEFKFNFILPDPNKSRIILERDKLGRIVHSKVR